MNGKHSLVIFSICLSLIPGCTSLKSTKLTDTNSSPPGLTYRLPAKQFTVKAAFEITQCIPRGQDADLEATVSATLTESLVGGEAYTVDYQELNTWTKVTNTEFQLSEAGLLTGVNASIADQTGAVISNSLTAVASIARASALETIPAVSTDNFAYTRSNLNNLDFSTGQAFDSSNLSDVLSNDPNAFNRFKTLQGQRIDEKLKRRLYELRAQAQDPCDPVKKALSTKKEAEVQLEQEKKLDKERANAQKKILSADIQIKALSELAETYGELGDDEQKGKLLTRIQLHEHVKDEATAALNTLGESAIEEITKSLSEAKEKLSVSATESFVPTDSDKYRDIVVKNDELRKLFKDRLNASKITLPLVRLTVEKLTIVPDNEAKRPEAAKTGIAYRVPVAAIAKVFYQPLSGQGSPKGLIDQVTQVPQFGPIGSINLDNVAFDDNLVELAFNATTGAPSKLTFRAKSKAEAASATVRDSAATYMQLQKGRQDDRIAANKVILDQATAQVALEKSQSDLALSKVQSDVAVIKAQDDLKQTQIATQLQLLRDQQRLDAVRTGTATTAEVELEALNTQEKLLEQKLKILKLEQDIAEQKAKAASSTTP